MKTALTLMLAASLVLPPVTPQAKTVSPTPAEKKPLVVPGMGTWKPAPPQLKPLKTPPKRWCPVGPTVLWRPL